MRDARVFTGNSVAVRLAYFSNRWNEHSRPEPFVGTDHAHYRAFEFIMASVATSANYVALFWAALYLKLAGRAPGDAVFDFLFPRGHQALLFMSVGLASEVMQDVSALVFARLTCACTFDHLASHGTMKKCAFTRIFPGWVSSW
jgi:hypothetical protein